MSRFLFLFFFIFLNQLFPAKFSYEVQFFTTDYDLNLQRSEILKLDIQKVILRLYHNKIKDGGLYFKNPWFTVKGNKLPAIINIQKSLVNKEFWGWMINRNFDWYDENNPLYDRHYNNGLLENVKKLDLFNDENVNRIVNSYVLLAKSGIKGVLIQDDLFFRYNEGFSVKGLQEYQRNTRLKPDISKMMNDSFPEGYNWKRIKMNRINFIINKIIRECKTVNKDFKIGMNIYYETPFFTEKSERWYAHNLKELALLDLDYFYIMTYQRQIKSEMKLNEEENLEMFRKIVDSAYKICGDRAVIKLQTRDWDTKERVSQQEILKYAGVINRGIKTICFTPVKYQDKDFLADIIKKIN